jgi:hypothetical protein
MASNNIATAFNDNSDILLPLLLVLLLRRRQHRPPTPSNRRWTGQEVVEDLLNSSSSTRIHNQLRIQLDTFYQLRNWLTNNTNLTGSWYLLIEEKLLIFIYIASTCASN